jgi:nitroreductase
MERPSDVVFTDEVAVRRKADYDILPLLLNRWSPRSMSGEPMTDDELLPLFEAARWAPSSYNAQLWRFIIARRQDEAAQLPEPDLGEGRRRAGGPRVRSTLRVQPTAVHHARA